MPPEKEGEAAARVKVADAVEGWRKAQALETELATVKATANPLPQEIEQELDALTTERGKFINALQDWQARNAPQPPNLALTDPNSPQYNPELFHAQVQNYQRQLGQQRDSQAQLQRLSERQELEEQALTNSRKTREIARLKETWPEVFTPEVGKQVRSDLDKYYGLDDKTIDSVLDSRFFAMAKDALRARAADAKQAEAVKAVKAKPRLVVSQARTKPANSARSDSFSRLQKTGTLDDAADALEGLF